MKTKRVRGWGILLFLSTLCAASAWCQEAPVTAPAPQTGAALQNSLKAFSAVYKLVEQNYADPVSPDLAIYGPSDSNMLGAIPAMLKVLDPHSTFFDPTQYADLRQQMQGHYYGVGMEIGPRPGKMGKMVTEVIMPLPESPAFRAGLRPGDIISAVNGQSTLNVDSTKVVDLLRG
ncbi:MAG: S41 family peptidase, partial [Terriglobia bacterium]